MSQNRRGASSSKDGYNQRERPNYRPPGPNRSEASFGSGFRDEPHSPPPPYHPPSHQPLYQSSFSPQDYPSYSRNEHTQSNRNFPDSRHQPSREDHSNQPSRNFSDSRHQPAREDHSNQPSHNVPDSRHKPSREDHSNQPSHNVPDSRHQPSREDHSNQPSRNFSDSRHQPAREDHSNQPSHNVPDTRHQPSREDHSNQPSHNVPDSRHKPSREDHSNQPSHNVPDSRHQPSREDHSNQPSRNFSDSRHQPAREDHSNQPSHNVPDTRHQPSREYHSNQPSHNFPDSRHQPSREYHSNQPSHNFPDTRHQPSRENHSNQPSHNFPDTRHQPSREYHSNQPSHNFPDSRHKPSREYHSNQPSHNVPDSRHQPSREYHSNQPSHNVPDSRHQPSREDHSNQPSHNVPDSRHQPSRENHSNRPSHNVPDSRHQPSREYHSNQPSHNVPDSRHQPSREDHSNQPSHNVPDSRHQPSREDHSNRPKTEPHYSRSGYQQNQPHISRPEHPDHLQNRSGLPHTGQQNRPSHFKNERNRGKQRGDRNNPADKNAANPGPPPLFQQQLPGRRKEKVNKLSDDKKSDFNIESKESGDDRQRRESKNRHQANRYRIPSTDSNIPVSERESEVLKDLQSDNPKEKHKHENKARGKVNKPDHVQRAQTTTPDRKDAASEERVYQDVKDKMKVKAPSERRASNASSVKSKQSRSSEVIEHITGAESGKKSRNRYQKRKMFREDKDKFQSMPDLNLKEDSESQITEEEKAKKQENYVTKKYNHKRKTTRKPAQNDNEDNENPEVASVSRITKIIEYDICGVENTPVASDKSAVKEKQNSKRYLKTDDFSRRSNRKKVTEMIERSSFKDEKKKATGKKKLVPSKAEVEKDRLSENVAERNNCNSETCTTPCKISVTINKIYPKTEDVSDLLSAIAKDKSLLIRLVPDSVVMTTKQTLCVLEVSNKENTRMIIEKLQAFEGVELHCFIVADGLPLYHDGRFKAENMQEQITKCIGEINWKIQRVLKLHEEKIDSLDNALKVMNSSAYNEDDSDDFDEDNNDEKAALSDKLVEVTKQKDTFSSKINDLIENLRKLEPLTATDKNLSDLLVSAGVECERLKAALPIYARREDIVRQVSQHQVSVILGETGSGKSTQMAQYLYEAGLAGQGMIVCTQPRKVAAITLTERVAKEMVDNVGNLVGYKTGMKKKMRRDKTKIVFVTDHCLLNECLADPSLSQYTCIIVDEAHERSIYTDLLLGMIKACLPSRPDLKVIITSATIDPQIFIRYFKSGPELRLSGRTFPVEVMYSKVDDSAEFENFEMKAVMKAVDIHKNEDPGDILVFLTSPVEIMRCCEEFEKLMTGSNDFKCFPLHGQLPPDEQRQVFQHLSKGVRKIVFATNCAETSITIDGIKYVIDTGVAKEMRFDGKKNICTLGTFVISKSSADQRKGRAGRTASGKCYRLFSEEGYQNMDVSSKPEILRVSLDQSVLKLAELGVDVKKYDFVQAPSAETIDSALSTLRDLGAISSEGITEVGRWISKLPLSPKEGFLVYYGYKKDLLYDSLVLASLIANGSNLFYRGMTESGAQISAKSKSEFGSIYGDVFTWLEVYKTWIKIPPKEQSKWCQKNGINCKAINFTRQFVKEMASVLKNEIKVKLENNFSSDESAPLALRKILFEANVTSVCHYLGHVRAGYYAVVAERQVHVHPSSTLLSNNSQPEWIVYTEFTKTSRDFIKGITAVEEDWVFEAAKEGRLNVDISLVKQLKSVLVHRETVGPSVFRKLVGARYSQLRVWEDKLAAAGMKAVVVEADYDLGTLDICSTSPIMQDIVDSFATIKQEIVKALKLEEAEISILKKQGTEPSGVRVLVGEGGCMKSLLLPDQSNTILIKKAHHSITEEDIRAKFAAFGDIKECVRFKRSDPWGFIRYGSCTEAQAAVDRTHNDEENCAVLKIDQQFKRLVSRFEARLSWCRRPIKGTGTAFIKCPSIEKASLVGEFISLPLRRCQLQVSRKGDELICLKTGNAREMEIKESIIRMLGYDESQNHNIMVTVLRDKAEPYSQTYINLIKDHLLDSFSKYMARDKFNINMQPAKGGAINQIAFIHFENPTEGFLACSQLKEKLFVASQVVEISPYLKTTVHVSKAILKVCKDRFDEIIKGLEKFKETNVHIRPLKQGDFAFDIKCENVKSMVEARELLQRELEGEIIDCTANNLVRKFLKQQGKEFLKTIERMLDVLIVVNERREQIHIYGTVAKVNETQVEINRYLSKLAEGKQVDICLKGPDKPPGLMKEIIKKYGSLHADLVQQFSLTDVVIDFRQQKLSIFGPVECVDNAVYSIAELAETLPRPGVSRVENTMPDCVVCMCPIENKSELHRLEACGHSYCLECFKLQVTVSVQDQNFPILCSEEHCGIPLVWKDFGFCIQKQWISQEKLMDKSVNAFVASNPQKYKFCLTPECPVIYEVTTNEVGCEFICPSCFVSLCTSCHTAYHAGLTCNLSSIEEEEEKQLKLWVMENRSQRKQCPKCKVGVEKIEGCNKMRCTSCGTYFCWICLAIAADSQKCYAHLVKEHGGFH